MALNKEDQETLQEIIDLDGNCLDGKPRCIRCPFRSLCLPEFLNPNPPTKMQRLNMSMRILVHNAIIDPDMTRDDIKNI